MRKNTLCVALVRIPGNLVGSMVGAPLPGGAWVFVDFLGVLDDSHISPIEK